VKVYRVANMFRYNRRQNPRGDTQRQYERITTVPMKDIALAPATEEKKSNIEEYEKKVKSHIGDKHPACLRCFDIRVHPEHGYKCYALPQDEQQVEPLSRAEENRLSTTEIYAHQMRMQQYHDTIQSRQDAMKSIYSYIVATMSKSSWQRIETFFQGVTQRGEEQTHQAAAPPNGYTEEGMKGLQDPLKLLSGIRLSHDVYDTSVPTLTCADALLRALELRGSGAAAQKVSYMQKSYDEYIALGGAQLPEELLTAIFFRKLGPQYAQAKSAIMNMAKLKAGAFPTTRGELATIVDGYKVLFMLMIFL